MAGVTGDIKSLFNYKYKKRDDELSDQYSRIFMPKVMLIAAFLTGMSWYSDEIACLNPHKSLVGETIAKYSGKACWVNGFYVSDELRVSKGCDGYYGLPTVVNHNGTVAQEPCKTCMAQTNSFDCKPMTKRFYIQYQWYPFFLAALAMLYYAPYSLFHIANQDLKSLKVEIKKLEPDVSQIMTTFFATDDPALMKTHKYNIMLNVLIKLGYLLSNIFVFWLVDVTLNGDFRNFGSKWVSWIQIPDHNNYVDRRAFINKGGLLLPTFGFCDVLEQGLDIKFSLINEYRLVCEISQHVLYHYIIIALWFLMILGIAVSLWGLLYLLILYVMPGSLLFKEKGSLALVFERITLRQKEYLRFVRKKNQMHYGKIMDCLYEKMKGDLDNSFGIAEKRVKKL